VSYGFSSSPTQSSAGGSRDPLAAACNVSKVEQASGDGESAVSIRDVAAAAGVSIATVSRVVNGTSQVAASTAAKVREAIRRLGYTPNPLAQALSGRGSHVIGLALPRFHGEFMTWLLHGADEEATHLGYHLMMTTIAKSDDGHARRQIVGSSLIDALLVVITEAEDPLAQDIAASGVPTVIIDTDMSARGVDSVVLDNERGTREAVEHLLRWVEPGALYFVGGPRGNFDTIQRAKAFSEALAQRGASPSPEQVCFGDYSLDWGKEWGIRMSRHKKLEGAAVLAANDKIACGIMQAAYDAGLRVPDQLRIVGFNDSQISRLVRPRLSTVSLPMAEMGAMAVRLLIRRIEDPAAEVVCSRLPTKLIVRESSTVVNF
jgi:DNA-binding LacI/PurR family transcriptional regulator